MRKIYSLLIALVLFSAANINAQNVNVSGAVSGNGTYATLGAAFTAIGTVQPAANIVIDVVGSTNEAAVVATLGAGTWATVIIQPSGGAARVITGAPAAGSPMIDLSGADNVTINGLNTGGNTLTIANTTVSNTSNTSTIRFIGGATNNTITNCNIQGSGTMSVATNGATIFFSTDAVTANGNDNNNISNNNIGPAGANLPTKAILGNGSTTTTAIGNSGNIINNNNIFDYFSVSGTSSGVATNGGCNTWTITNNRVYQTATRTWTTGATHRGIDINPTTATSGAQGFTITGNIIGYATNTQTGVYTLTGSTGKFHGINFNGITGGTSSTISNNTIASVSLSGVTSNGTSTSSPFIGILVTNGVATTDNNTIGSQSATSSLVLSSNSTTATDVIGIYNFSTNAWTSNNNNIGGISVTNAAASGTFIIYGMRANTGSGVTWTAGSNNVGGTVANSIQLTATGISSQVVGMFSSNAPMLLASNTVRNLTTNIGTGTSNSASVIGISHTSTTPVNSISQCTIHTLANTNATAASVVTGIQFTGATGNIVERNFIYNLNVSTTSATAEVNGIRIGGGTTTYRNNMIALGANIANAIGGAATNSSTSGINGINGALGTDNIWHNSIYIGGTATAGVGSSYAFNGTQTTNTRSFRDNIFFNARTNGGATGSHYAIKINGTVPNPTGLTINNNVYFANGTGAVFGFFNSLPVANLAAWKTALGQDANSFEGNPQYLAPTASTPDLHISAVITTPAEGNGADLGVVLDFDGQTRSGLTPVDIGADAGNFIGADLSGPVITYTPLSSTCTLTGVTLTATVSDAGSGVATSGIALPVLYWRVNAGAYTAVTGSFVSGSTYSFGLFGGGSVGDVISYYIVAQDLAGTPNISANPSGGAGGFSANPPAASTAPTTPSSFALQNSIGGTYTVGSGGAYATITAAVAAYNTSCLTSAVVFNLTDASYAGETFPITINANSFASSTNTLTIKTTQPATAITGLSASALFVLNGADYVTIDGSTGSTPNTVCPASSASRDLTLTNTSTSTSSAVVWLQTATGANAATNNAVINCNLIGNSNTQTLFGVGSGSTTISTASLGTGNINNSFVNNNISKTQFGIFSQGASAANKNTGTVINQNSITTVSPNNVQIGGIYVGFDNGATISGNTVAGMVSGTDAFGISTGVTSWTATTTTGNEVSNAVISKNTIGLVQNTGTNSAAGILVGPSATGTNQVSNNMLYGVIGNSTPGDLTAGIFTICGAGATQVYYNSVSMTGDRGTGTTASSLALAVMGTDPTIDIRNNILVNKQTTVAAGKSYAIGLGYSTFVNLTSNNNDFFTSGANAFFAVTTALNSGTDRTSLGAWQTATTKDGASLNIDPVFTSATDLHLVPASNATLNDFGTPVSVTDDIDCTTRSVTTPDMGADEFAAPGCVTAVGGTASGDAAFCASGTPTITNTGFSTGTGSTYQWYSSTLLGDYPNAGTAVGGQTNAASLTTGVVTTTTYYWLRVTCATNSSTDNSSLVTITVNPNPTAPVTPAGPVTICAPATQLLDGSGTNAASPIYQWRNNTVDIGGETNATYTASATGSYSVRVQDGVTGCFAISAAVSVTVNLSPSAVTVTPPTATICAGGSVNLAASGGDISGTGVQIGFGTSSSTASSTGAALGPNPLQSFYGGSKQQMIVLASELSALGMANGSQISSVSFDLSAAETGRTLLDLQVKISTTALSAFASTTFQAAGTVVRNAASLTVAAGWNPIAFDNNFTWNGTDNLLIEVNFSNADAGGTGTSTAVYSTTAFASTLFYRVDNVAAATVDAQTTASFTAYTQRNNMQFDFTTPASFVWTPAASGLDVYTGANVVASPAATITYTATSTINGCPASNTAAVTVNPNYDITASSGANGTVTPAGITTLSCDGTGDQTYTITPDGGYLISDLTVDGVSNTALTTGSYALGGTYDFINVTANHTISATFTLAACINNTFSGTGNWSDGTKWSCGAPPASGDNVTIAASANATLDVDFTVAGSLVMTSTSTLTVNPTRTLTVSGTANFAGQAVTFLSDATGTASLGQVTGTLSNATNVTVERFIPNNGFRSWRLLSVPTITSQSIRQAWQEGDANPLPQQNNLANRGTQITGVFTTQAAAVAAGFDSTSVQAGMLRWNGASWSNITSTTQAINNFNSYFLYIRGERSKTVTGAVSNTSATTLRTKGTVYTGDQTTNVGASAFALVPNLYPSAINFTGLTRTGGVNNLFYIWDSKKLNGNSLGVYQTFSNTNSFNCLISGGSYTVGVPNTTIESGQSFFVTSGAAGTIVLKETAKISGTTGSLGFRPTPSAIKSKIDTRLYNHLDEMLDANTVVFDAAYSKAVSEEDAPKLGNPGANFAIENNSKLLAIEGTASVKENDAIQFRMWNLAAGNYKLEFAVSKLNLPAGTNAMLEDSYLKTATAVNANGTTVVNFTTDQNAASMSANRFRIVFSKAKAITVDTEQGYTIAPNPIENGVMNVVFRNQKAGKYSVRLIAAGGQSVMIKTVTHAGGNSTQNISLPSVMGRGTYTVEITAPDKLRSTQTVLVNKK